VEVNDFMSDPTIVAIISKTLLAALLILGGIVALFIGRSLYLKGMGFKPDSSSVAAHKVKASLKTVGSVVMATSVAWGGLGYLTAPHFTNGPGGTSVAVLKLPNFDVVANPIVFTISKEIASKLLSDTDALKDSFVRAYRTVRGHEPVVTINAKPVDIELNRISTLRTNQNQILIVSVLKAGGNEVALTYKAKIKGEKVLFVPEIIGVLDLKYPLNLKTQCISK
jgi:hypothetical protein